MTTKTGAYSLLCAALLCATGGVRAQEDTGKRLAIRQMGDGQDGMLKNGKPITKGWTSLFDGKTLHRLEVRNGLLAGQGRGYCRDKGGSTPHHHYMFSDKDYADFELHIDVKMTGYNSGVCTRINPKSYDDVPGYQVDMGEGYWGCLWDEHHRQKKSSTIQKRKPIKFCTQTTGITISSAWQAHISRFISMASRLLKATTPAAFPPARSASALSRGQYRRFVPQYLCQNEVQSEGR